MAKFEQACKDNGLVLFVLPPKLNGAVERAHLYNNYRPHGVLGGQTSSEYFNRTSLEAQPSRNY